ncbi:hypothetical protein GCM10007140_05170 [Priestia taiwanensis]|uniref:Uncharacterized protein n=2 Tax=Priestia taiwanensis TaxID=1347902 RepID=A0A917AK90_9BACI|nr:hypothetical protein GCM10007140_05170 [Priestia taiwanensis]
MHIKVKAKNVRFTIPVPYAMLNIAISIFHSKLVQQNVSKKTDFPFQQLDKKMLKSIVKDLKNYKGLVLVDVKAKDGTEVKVRL